ncbi:hypothetical protein ONS95_007657 [Cadophora gregata]|uniref:uncharacterized protein n=1 Tax=Cadophora gregata TaxID=51156 RepID=UPI0026DB08D8|nr:uncharacterized protein ONS95_007657 [Cadophora gregata]KAK0126036.1 hypothetical protein ONS95_007657 [Cadophora gregata]
MSDRSSGLLKCPTAEQDQRTFGMRLSSDWPVTCDACLPRQVEKSREMTRKLKTTTYLRMRVFSKTLKRDQCIKVYNRKYRNTSAYLLPPDEGFDFVMHSRVNILIEAADNGTSSEHPKQRTCSKRCAFSYYPNCLLRAGQQMTGSWLWVSLANNQQFCVTMRP